MPDTETEFDDIVAALRDERPRIDPTFARELDTRAAAGFPRKRRRLRLPKLGGIPMHVPALGLGAVAALIITIGVVGSGGDDTLTTSGSGGGSGASSEQATADALQGGRAAPEAPYGRTAGKTTSAQPASGSAASLPALVPPAGGARNRVQEQSASMTLLAPPEQVPDVGDRILGVADQVGGFVVSSQVRATDGASGGGDFQLRVPAARLDDALARLSRLGHVRERQQGVQDITAERNSARDQVEEAGAERRSLLRRLATADTDNEVASLRARLRDVNATIAAFRDALTRVNRRVQYASVSVTLVAGPDKDGATPGDNGSWTPGDAAHDALRVLEVAAGVLLLIAAVLVPFALLAAATIAARRLSGRRGRERALDAT